jgi:mono/diheme cytochrome c family protein
MSTSTSAILGLVFLGLANASVFLMYKLWGYPFDHETRKSEAPRSLMLVHRLIGYAYAILYVFMMWHMVPRLWNYQVELPPRTVAHLMLGITIGVLLLVKIAILRFFRHFEEMMPYIGTTLLLCTYLLISLSVPFTLRERALRTGAHVSGNVFSEGSIQRIRRLLDTAGLPDEAPLDQLASKRKMREGQRVLLRQCVQCHDLRTILVRPRTPPDWVRLVNRMALKPVIGEPLTEENQWAVSTYLIAITPDIQNSVKEQRKQRMQASQAQVALRAAFIPSPDVVQDADAAIQSPDDVVMTSPDAEGYDPAAAQELFEITCSQCHPLSDVDDAPPTSEQETQDLIQRMIEENGLFILEEDIAIVARYLNETYVQQ